MDFDLIFLLAGLGIGALAVYLFCISLFGRNSGASALAWAEDDEPVRSKMPLIQFSRPLVHSLTLQHVKKIKSPKYRGKVEQRILTAGLKKELNVDEFIGLQILWGFMFPLFFIIANFALSMGYPYIASVGMAVFGFYFPQMYCSSQKNKRYSSVVVELPFFVDLLALSTEAGLDFFGAIQKLTEKVKNSTLGDEFLIVQKDLKLGSSRKDALLALSKRLDMDEVTSVCTMIIDSDETGASIAKTLKAKSEQMRNERFSRAEAAGAKASQKMLFPMVAFILPAVFIAVFAPVGLQFIYGGGV